MEPVEHGNLAIKHSATRQARLERVIALRVVPVLAQQAAVDGIGQALAPSLCLLLDYVA